MAGVEFGCTQSVWGAWSVGETSLWAGKWKKKRGIKKRLQSRRFCVACVLWFRPWIVELKPFLRSLSPQERILLSHCNFSFFLLCWGFSIVDCVRTWNIFRAKNSVRRTSAVCGLARLQSRRRCWKGHEIRKFSSYQHRRNHINHRVPREREKMALGWVGADSYSVCAGGERKLFVIFITHPSYHDNKSVNFSFHKKIDSRLPGAGETCWNLPSSSKHSNEKSWFLLVKLSTFFFFVFSLSHKSSEIFKDGENRRENLKVIVLAKSWLEEEKRAQ